MRLSLIPNRRRVHSMRRALRVWTRPIPLGHHLKAVIRYVFGQISGPTHPFSRKVTLPTLNTSEKIEARYSVLASLPLPSGVPEDSLTPVLIPPPYTLHDFIGTTSGVSLSPYTAGWHLLPENT